MRRRILVIIAVLMASLPLAASTNVHAAAATSAFDAIAPTRIVDASGDQRLVANRSRSVVVAGLAGVPSSATAVVLNVLAASSAPGDLRVWATGSPMPLVSTLTLSPGGPIAQLVTVPLGAAGGVDLRSSVAADVFVDVQGYYAPAANATKGRFVPAETIASASFNVSAGGTSSFDLTSAVPADVEAVVVALRAAGGVGTWSLGGVPVLSVRMAETAVNRVIVPSRSLDLVSTGGGLVTVDVLGWYTGASASSSSDGLFVALAPQRLFDTTSSVNSLGIGVALHAGWTAELPLALAGAGSILVNVSLASTHGIGDVVVSPSRRARIPSPVAVASRAGQAVSGQTVVALSSSAVSIWSAGGTEASVDLVGYFTGTPLAATNGAPVNALPVGDTFPGELWIPAIKLRTVVRENADLVDFDPVHIPESRSPNQPGNVAIFGHRTSHGREFRNLDRLKKGSLVVLVTNGRTYTYTVTAVGVLKPDDPALWASSSNDQTLTLVACHPPGSVRFRIVAFARLTSVA